MIPAGAALRASRPLCALALAALLVVACGAPQREAAPPDPASARLISLSPGVSRVIVALGARERLVGVDRYSREHPALADLPSLGGLFAPDIERAFELRPDLVLGVSSAQQRDFFAALRARGIRCEEIDTSGRLDDVLAAWLRVGELIGRPAAAAALVAATRDGLQALRGGHDPAAPTQRVALVLDVDPLFVVGAGSFVHDLIEIAGGDNVFGDIAAPYPRVSLELLVGRAPDLVLDASLGERDPATLEAARRRWQRLGGAGRVAFLPRGATTLPGPDLVRGAERIRDALAGREPAE